MKWFILIGAALTMWAPGAAAQQPDTAQVLVHYKFSHVQDTTDRARPYTENMVLVIGKKAAVYRSYDRQLQEAQFRKQMQEQMAASGGGNVRFNRHISGSGTEYYQFPNDHKMVRKESLFHNFLVTEALLPIDWQVSGDTATFGGLHCQKATAHVKGRDYTAWFCPDLPLHVGPWKLNGLPGVIVEAYDAKQEVRFTFAGVEKAQIPDQPAGQAVVDQPHMPGLPGMEDEVSDPNIIKLPENATKTTDKEFAQLQEAFKKDPSAFAQAMMAGPGGGMSGDGGPASGGRPGPGGSAAPGGRPPMKIDIKAAPGPVINNPIELPEKK